MWVFTYYFDSLRSKTIYLLPTKTFILVTLLSLTNLEYFLKWHVFLGKFYKIKIERKNIIETWTILSLNDQSFLTVEVRAPLSRINYFPVFSVFQGEGIHTMFNLKRSLLLKMFERFTLSFRLWFLYRMFIL